MNISKIILAGSFVGLVFASCANEEFTTTEMGTITEMDTITATGTISLIVDKVEPSATRAVSTADFPVAIYSLNDNKQIVSYESADQVPAQIKLGTGMYYATAHTPGALAKTMTAPYYEGRDTFEILQNINTISEVVCRMANSRISVYFSDDFMQTFTSWTVSITDNKTDGTGTAITYSYEKDGLNIAPIYVLFGENVSELNVNFWGTTTKGNRITTASVITKSQASEQYDNDNANFTGGDCIVLNFKPVESTENDFVGISISANIRFDESEEDFKMEVEDKIPDEGFEEDVNGGDTPGGSGDSNAITLNLPEDMIVSAVTDPSLGDTYIAAEHGIKSISVKMISTSDAMMASLADLSGNYNGVDFVAGAEVVGNQEMVRLFGDLGQTLAVPAEGDTEYVFPIGNFFSLLAFLPGEHSFTLVITDMEGNTKDGLLKLTVE